MKSLSAALISKWSQDFGERFARRLTGKQKDAFLKAIADELGARNFETERIKIRLGLIPNRLLITKCKNPKVIFLAHYDTPTIMPPGFSLIYRVFGHTRQGIASVFAIILMMAIFAFHSWLEFLAPGFWPTAFLILVLIVFVIPFFFPNPRNAEDNTSGVLGLLALADWAQDKLCKDDIQFVFLDNEEWGLIGSSALRKMWKKSGHIHVDTTIINLDCISRGETPLLVHHKNDRVAQEVLPFLQTYLPGAKIFDMKGIPLSDNYTFRNLGAIDISFADPSIIPGGYYIPRVHVPKDKDFYPEKTALLIEGITAYLQNKLSSQ